MDQFEFLYQLYYYHGFREATNCSFKKNTRIWYRCENKLAILNMIFLCKKHQCYFYGRTLHLNRVLILINNGLCKKWYIGLHIHSPSAQYFFFTFYLLPLSIFYSTEIWIMSSLISPPPSFLNIHLRETRFFSTPLFLLPPRYHNLWLLKLLFHWFHLLS